ncbi:MAG: DUF58 domain-containing protein [Actinomycetota bacterium]
MTETTTESVAGLTAERLLHRLDLRVVRRLDGHHPGEHRTFLLGAGVDFADLREYQPHDDVRNIDWNVTARMDSPFVREYVADRELTAWLLVDRSASMRFGVEGSDNRRPKAETVTQFVTVIARLLTLRGNRVGVAVFDDGVHQVIEPAGGRSHVLRIVHELLRPEQAAGPREGRWPWRRRSAETKAAARRTELGVALTTAAKAIRRRSLVIVLSDFISEPGWERPLGILARKHEVICIRITDPDEEQIPSNGMQVFEDLETGEQLTVDTSDSAFRARFAEMAELRERELRSAVATSGLSLQSLSTDEDLVGALVRLSQSRRR